FLTVVSHEFWKFFACEPVLVEISRRNGQQQSAITIMFIIPEPRAHVSIITIHLPRCIEDGKRSEFESRVGRISVSLRRCAAIDDRQKTNDKSSAGCRI